MSATSVCVRVGGSRVVLRRVEAALPYRARPPRGSIVEGAAAAGRSVAWIETSFRGGRRVVVVKVVRIGADRAAHAVRRLVVRRDRSRDQPYVDVAITRRGELAWLQPTRRRSLMRVVYAPPGVRPRTVAFDSAEQLSFEDRITLRWGADGDYGFYDLPRPAGACPHRSRYREIAANDRVRVTQGSYDEGDSVVLRACMLATGRDRVFAGAFNFPDGDSLAVTGLYDRWIVLLRASNSRYDPCQGGYRQSTIDARTGRSARVIGAPLCGSVPRLLQAGDPLAVTARGVPAWLTDGRLLTAAPGRVAEIDRGNIAALRANGDAVEWTNDGVPRSAVLP